MPTTFSVILIYDGRHLRGAPPLELRSRSAPSPRSRCARSSSARADTPPAWKPTGVLQSPTTQGRGLRLDNPLDTPTVHSQRKSLSAFGTTAQPLSTRAQSVACNTTRRLLVVAAISGLTARHHACRALLVALGTRQATPRARIARRHQPQRRRSVRACHPTCSPPRLVASGGRRRTNG